MDLPLPDGFWRAQIALVAGVAGIYYGSGALVRRFGVRVNYTRKVVHFATFLLPTVVDRLLLSPRLGLSAAGISVLTAFLLLAFLRPVRERVPVFATMFASIDRPEDRPHTLVWLATQLVAGFAVLLLFGDHFHRIGHEELILVPVIVNGIGDGLAEPVGVRWGRHRYRVRSLFGQAGFTRSLEGSAVVFLVSAITVAAFRASFSMSEFLVAAAVLPLLMTLAEAFSPHTWDSPILFLVGGSTLSIVLDLVP